jgi:hypothetical protein
MINPRLPRISPEVSAIGFPALPARTGCFVWHRVIGPSSNAAGRHVMLVNPIRFREYDRD